MQRGGLFGSLGSIGKDLGRDLDKLGSKIGKGVDWTEKQINEAFQPSGAPSVLVIEKKLWFYVLVDVLNGRCLSILWFINKHILPAT